MKFFPLIFLLTCMVLTASSQESVITAAAEATGPAGTVSYTIGQTCFHAYGAPEGDLGEGVQQPYEILFMTGMDEPNEDPCRITVSPNPFADELTITTKELPEPMQYELKSMTGVVLLKGRITTTQTMIGTETLPAGYYLIMIFSDRQPTTIRKIIKR